MDSETFEKNLKEMTKDLVKEPGWLENIMDGCKTYAIAIVGLDAETLNICKMATENQISLYSSSNELSSKPLGFLEIQKVESVPPTYELCLHLAKP